MSHPLSMRLLRVGACRHLECIAARGGRYAMVEFPSLCGLIRHPRHGWILYDTGYADHFIKATETWPEKLYRSSLPVNLPASEVLTTQLAQAGITAADIAYVVISHYHGDHVAGLRDFPNARFIALRADTEQLLALRGRRWRATLQGQLPSMLPDDFLDRLQDADASPRRELPAWMAPFREGLDLLGDGSLIGVALPGHSNGHLGLLLPDVDGRPVFLVADACWSMPACREGRLPSRLALLVTAQRRRFGETFFSLRELALREPSLSLLPSHCSVSWKEFFFAA
jgi:glyoxylase-like metal-dependent hydrolase (beta-lactamase superfamily II)